MKKIGIFGHVGNKNLGDEAIIAAVIQNIRSRYPTAEIAAFTINPHDTRERHAIPAFPIRRLARNSQQEEGAVSTTVAQTFEGKTKLGDHFKIALKTVPLVFLLLKGIQKSLSLLRDCVEEVRFWGKCYKNLRGTDLLIIAGSHQLNDYVGGPWAFPYTLLKWSVIAKMTGTKVAFASVGAGPITTWLGQAFLKYSLLLASYRSYRDEVSREQIQKIGIRGENSVFPDLVYSLQIPQSSLACTPLESLPIVGINPMPVFHPDHWHEANSQMYQRYVQELVGFAEWLIKKNYRVLFFPTQLRVDPFVINDIQLIMKKKDRECFDRYLVQKSIKSFDDLVYEISRMDIVVATRFHGILISSLLEKPILGIAYHKKSEELMAQVGQAKYALGAADVNLDSLKERFNLLESEKDSIRELIKKKLPTFRQALEKQYEQVFRLLEEKESFESYK